MPFTLVVHSELAEAPVYDIYKHTVKASVEVTGIEDSKLREAVEKIFSTWAANLSDWTHKNLEGASDIFYAIHAVGLKLARISGSISSNGKSLSLDSSSRDLHLSTIEQDAS